jgi:hypothetical protein
MDSRDRLEEVAARGAPAQSAKARELLSRLATDPQDLSAPAETDALFDAYLHDPYLTKIEPSDRDRG